MTGVQNTQITHMSTLTHDIIGPAASLLQTLNIGEVLRLAPMHVAMSNVYDQFRVRKVTLKITPSSTTEQSTAYATLFTVFDRNGFPQDVSLESLLTYSSYKQTAYSMTASNKAPIHYVSWENNTLFEKSRYYSTKLKPQAGYIAVGTMLPAPLTQDSAVKLIYNISWTFDITYRGLRMDPSVIGTTIGHPE